MERPDLSGILSISIAASANVGQTVNSIFSGESQSKTCPQGKLLRRSERILERLAKEPSMVRQKWLSANAERHRKSRKLENKEDSKNQKKSGTPYVIGVVGNVLNLFYMVKSIALLYLMVILVCEIASGRKDEYKQCCHDGSVELLPLLSYPDEMKLFLQAADVDGRNFREHVLNYNSALAFASLAAQIAAPTTREPYCFRIHEQIYRRIGALHPGENQRAQYGQLYILDSTLALQERMGNVGSYRCNENIMKMLGNVMTRISPFAAAFKMMHEVEQEEIRRSKREKRAPASIRMIFDNNCRMRDQRRYNLPRANQVTAVFIGDNGEVPKYRHVTVHPRGQNLQTISILHAHCDSMAYPILFPREDERWHPELEKVDRSRNRKRVSMLQFYSCRLTVHENFSTIHHAGTVLQQYIVDAYFKSE
ncbi:unnamed protein product [Rotaria magnacalcarata]|uniref:Helitron helicase-like domain-containing protein n=1 Tax=Rotaria magnacalcarata TaxID=392030 RepID=A0A816TZE9_9BILA|nr:unnamed protein product [Rotaria magnacalcarata]